jgi:hypothetical protein
VEVHKAPEQVDSRQFDAVGNADEADVEIDIDLRSSLRWS